MTGTYAVKKIAVAADDLSVKPLSPVRVAITLQLPEIPTPKFADSVEPNTEHEGWLISGLST
jgi:hypothetical protein